MPAMITYTWGLLATKNIVVYPRWDPGWLLSTDPNLVHVKASHKNKKQNKTKIIYFLSAGAELMTGVKFKWLFFIP